MENYLDSKESEHENSGSGAEVTSDQSGVRDQASGEKKDLHSRYINYIERPEINGVFVGTYRSRALSMIKVPNSFVILSVCCICLVVIVSLCLVFVPWQQSIDGRGKVIIFSPMERPQHLEAPIPGRILKWFVRDGESVKKGDSIVELSEVDPKYLAANQLLRMRAHLTALQEKKAAAISKVRAMESQIKSLKLSRTSSVASVDMKKAQTLDRYSAAKQAVTVAQQNLKTSELNLERRKSLYEKGLRSKRDLELAEQEMVKNKTELERALVQLEVARKEMEVADFELSKTDADTLAKIDSTSASLSSARETVATTEAEIQKLIIEIGSLENRIVQRVLTAPCDGRVVRLMVAGAGETVSAGTQMAVIAPATNDLAAELLVKGNDAPLIAPGRPVRLQFAGWPAVQFTGWPSVAVGTFAGRVSVVDAVDDGTGKFRIIVVPDEKAVELNEDQPWPSSQFLRPGSEVHGWVMLNTVPLGFELWRQFNAFPPSLKKEEMQSKLGDVKRKTK